MPSVTPQWFNNSGPQPYLVIQGEDGYMRWLKYLPDGRRVVTGSRDGTVWVWNLESGKQEWTSMKHESEISGLAVIRGGTKIITSGCSGKIKMWDVESHKLVKEWSHPESCPVISISPDDRLVAVGTKNVGIYTMEGIRVNHSIKVGVVVWLMCFSPNRNKLACRTEDGISVYNVASGTLILGLGGDRVFDVLWSHNGSRLFASDGSTIRCWNSDTGKQIGHPWRGHISIIRSLSLSPDGSILASASWDTAVRFRNATTGDPIGRLQHAKGVNTVRFSPSGEFVVSTGWDGKIYVWRVPWLNSVTHQVASPFSCVLTSALICHFRHWQPSPTYVAMKLCPHSSHRLLAPCRTRSYW